MILSFLRVVLIPLVLLCVSPSPSHPVFGNSVLVWAAMFSFFLGLSNGYAGSLPMINVADEVSSERDKELAGQSCQRNTCMQAVMDVCYRVL